MAENVGTLYVKLDLDDKDFDKGLDNAKTKADKGGSFIGSAFKGAALGGILAVGTAFAAVAHEGLSFNNGMEQAKARLNALNKDANQTEKDLSFINAEAAKTPFAFEEMVKSFAALKPAAKTANMDVKDLLSTAEILAAVNPAQGLDGAAIALRSAVSGDFTSAIERFDIPRELIQKLKDEGVPNAQIVGQALQQMGYDMSLVSNMANTAEGRWSTLQDTFKVLAGTITQPIFDAFSGGLGGLNDILTANQPLISAFATQIAGSIKSGLEWLFNVGIPNVIAAFNMIKPTIDFVIAAFNDGMASSNQLSGVIDFLATTWKNLQPTINAVVNAIQSIINTVFTAIQEFLKANGTDIQTFLSNAWNQIKQIITLSVQLINATIVPIFKGIAAFIMAHKEEIVGTLTNAWNIIKGVVTGALNVIEGIIKLVLSVIKGDWQGAWDGIKLIVSGTTTIIQSVISGFINAIKSTLSLGWDAIKSVASSAWDYVYNSIIKPVADKLASVFNGPIESIKSAFSSIGGAIKSALNDVIGLINSAIKGYNTLAGAIGADTLGSIPKLASGIRNFAGGLALVGEQGPELVNLPKGANVMPNTQTMQTINNFNLGGVVTASSADNVMSSFNRMKTLGNAY